MLQSLRPLFGLGLLLGACSPPTETRHLVASERAPLIPEAEDDERAFATLRRGEVVEVVRSVRTLDWKAELEDEKATRAGELLELRRSGWEGAAFGFRSDLGGEVQVPTAPWLCRAMHGDDQCTPRLRRFYVGDALIAWEPCQIGACRVALVRGRSVKTITVDGLADLYAAKVEGMDVLIGMTRWVKSPVWTGATTEIIRIGDRLMRSLTINSEELDSRAAPVIQRMGTVKIEGGVLTYRGSRREILPSNGALMANKPIVETYHIAK